MANWVHIIVSDGEELQEAMSDGEDANGGGALAAGLAVLPPPVLAFAPEVSGLDFVRGFPKRVPLPESNPNFFQPRVQAVSAIVCNSSPSGETVPPEACAGQS